ncbi:MAG: Gram-negative bacterial TonB protein C-terminal [Pseudomonadota bacterium]|jgi:TonB family protein
MMFRNLCLFALFAVPAVALAQQAPPAPADPVSPVVASEARIVPVAELRSRPIFLRGAPIDDLPEYAVLAEAGRYGRVVAKATITPEGRLRDIVMDTPSGDPTVDAAIVRTLQGWALSSPIDKSGAKVATTGYFPVTIGQFPKRLSGASPEMPQAAKDAFHNGKVSVNYSIDLTGTPVDAKITRSSKSELLDGAVLAAIAASRFEKPIGLDGKPRAVPVSSTYQFSQMDGEGSYIGSLRFLRCRIVVGEVDWWIAANPEAKVSDMEFTAFMGGLALLTPEALGWGKVDITQIHARHMKAWDGAMRTCRAKPESLFMEAYRKG